MTAAPQDLFAEARHKFKIADAWKLLGLEGEPKASCRSPFREDRSPSFSIHSDGQAWTDHATGDGGDVIEFIKHAIGGDHREVRLWLAERIGTHSPAKLTSEPLAPPEAAKRIAWPGEIVEGTTATWQAFADRRGLTFPAVHAMVSAGLLRFIRIEGVKCYAITDATHRAAEIRRMDGQPFGKSKSYPLRGVDKSWLPGAELLTDAPPSSVLVTEAGNDESAL